MKSFTYKIKCRYCNRITKMKIDCSDRLTFEGFIENKLRAPQHSRCDCDPDSMILHDLISYCL